MMDCEMGSQHFTTVLPSTEKTTEAKKGANKGDPRGHFNRAFLNLQAFPWWGWADPEAQYLVLDQTCLSSFSLTCHSQIWSRVFCVRSLSLVTGDWDLEPRCPSSRSMSILYTCTQLLTPAPSTLLHIHTTLFGYTNHCQCHRMLNRYLNGSL